jgi:hypothetical protein
MKGSAAVQEHVRVSALLIEGSREALESSRALLQRTDRLVGSEQLKAQ